MENPIIFTAEIIGTIAFASSGAMLGIRKNLDLFGVLVLGLCVAVGGGIVRDIILGRTPPGAFRDPIYALVALGTSALLFLLVYGKQEIMTSRYLTIYEQVMNYGWAWDFYSPRRIYRTRRGLSRNLLFSVFGHDDRYRRRSDPGYFSGYDAVYPV